MALESTCKKGQVFEQLYLKASKGEGVGETAYVEECQFGTQTCPAYFTILERPVVIEGQTKKFD